MALPKTVALRIDDLFFVSLLLGALLLAIHRKAISDVVFNDGTNFLVLGYHHAAIYFLTILTAVLYGFSRRWKASFRVRGTALFALTLLYPASCQALASSPAMLVFFLQLYLSSVAAAIVFGADLLTRDLPTDFWKLFFDNSMKSIRYVLVVFTAGLAVLQYLSTGKGESPEGFLTTLFYPAAILVLSIGMAGQWVLLPAGEKLIDAYASEQDEDESKR